MNVVLDLRCVHPGMTGIGRYAVNLLVSLLSVESPPHLSVITTDAGRVVLQQTARGNFKTIIADQPGWDQLILPDLLAREQADVYHSPLFCLPAIRTCSSVCTIHDVIPIAAPDLTPAKYKETFVEQIRSAASRADHVLTVSNYSRNDILTHLGLEPDRVSVIYEPVSPFFRSLPPSEVVAFRRKLDLPDSFFLFVGALDRRKNLSRLIRAFKSILSEFPDQHLLIVGGPWGVGYVVKDDIRDAGVESRVRLLGRVSDSDLLGLYCAATCFVFPSLYEGFGLPPLEAMACGTPVIASATTSLPEVTGTAALGIQPQETASIAEAMRQVLENPQVASSLARMGPEQSLHFTPEAQGRGLMKLYGQLVKEAA